MCGDPISQEALSQAAAEARRAADDERLAREAAAAIALPPPTQGAHATAVPHPEGGSATESAVVSEARVMSEALAESLRREASAREHAEAREAKNIIFSVSTLSRPRPMLACMGRSMVLAQVGCGVWARRGAA